MKAAGSSSRPTPPAPASVRLTPRRARLLEAIAEQLAAQVGRPVSPTAAIGLVVDRGMEALAALERERAREAASPKARRQDPDSWPASASARAVYFYREAVRVVTGAWGGGVLSWRCAECECFYAVGRPTAPTADTPAESFYGVAPFLSEHGRRWWECPTCAPSESTRRRVRALRASWSWPAAEAEAARRAAEQKAKAEEGTVRLALAGARAVLEDWPALQREVCRVAGLERLPREPGDCSDDEQRFRCRRCASTWQPFDPPPNGPAGEPWMHSSECRAPLAWWACANGCNARAASRVARLARGPLARAWVGPVDAEAAAHLRVAARALSDSRRGGPGSLAPARAGSSALALPARRRTSPPALPVKTARPH